jgi:hypothetical protein
MFSFLIDIDPISFSESLTAHSLIDFSEYRIVRTLKQILCRITYEKPFSSAHLFISCISAT